MKYFVYFLGAETEENGQDDSNDGEDHECTDECGFCADDDGKKLQSKINFFSYLHKYIFISNSSSSKYVDQKRASRFQRFYTKRRW